MTQWTLRLKPAIDKYRPQEWEIVELPDEVLLVMYEAGDCDVAYGPAGAESLLHRALYDLYQTSDDIKEGDQFLIDGKVAFYTESFHVFASQE